MYSYTYARTRHPSLGALPGRALVNVALERSLRSIELCAFCKHEHVQGNTVERKNRANSARSGTSVTDARAAGARRWTARHNEARAGAARAEERHAVARRRSSHARAAPASAAQAPHGAWATRWATRRGRLRQRRGQGARHELWQEFWRLAAGARLQSAPGSQGAPSAHHSAVNHDGGARSHRDEAWTFRGPPPRRAIAPLAPWDHPFGRPNQEHPSHGPLANYRASGLADMAEAIMDGRDHRCSLDLSLHAVDVMTSILRAGETGQWVDLTTTCARPDALGPEAAAKLLKD